MRGQQLKAPELAGVWQGTMDRRGGPLQGGPARAFPPLMLPPSRKSPAWAASFPSHRCRPPQPEGGADGPPQDNPLQHGGHDVISHDSSAQEAGEAQQQHEPQHDQQHVAHHEAIHTDASGQDCPPGTQQQEMQPLSQPPFATRYNDHELLLSEHAGSDVALQEHQQTVYDVGDQQQLLLDDQPDEDQNQEKQDKIAEHKLTEHEHNGESQQQQAMYDQQQQQALYKQQQQELGHHHQEEELLDQQQQQQSLLNEHQEGNDQHDGSIHDPQQQQQQQQHDNAYAYAPEIGSRHAGSEEPALEHHHHLSLLSSEAFPASSADPQMALSQPQQAVEEHELPPAGDADQQQPHVSGGMHAMHDAVDHEGAVQYGQHELQHQDALEHQPALVHSQGLPGDATLFDGGGAGHSHDQQPTLEQHLHDDGSQQEHHQEHHQDHVDHVHHVHHPFSAQQLADLGLDPHMHAHMQMMSHINTAHVAGHVGQAHVGHGGSIAPDSDALRLTKSGQPGKKRGRPKGSKNKPKPHYDPSECPF